MKRLVRTRLIGAFAVVSVGCGSAEDPVPPVSGFGPTGGAISVGGTPATGGMSGSGGLTSLGGAAGGKAVGGTTGAGGASGGVMPGSGGVSAAGGTATGGSNATGGARLLGGNPATSGGATGLGGAMVSGGAANSGGTTPTATGGKGSGGTSTAGGTLGNGGSSTGGAMVDGGTPSSGGTVSTGGGSPTGGATTGGSSTGGSSTGGTAVTGGAASTGGTSSAGSTGCGVPTGFKWTSSDALISPQSDSTHNLASIKDPTVVYYNGRWHVYATVFNTTTNFYNMVYLNFTDWAQAGSATQYYMDQTPGFAYYHCAPQLFYFSPQGLWYLVYQSQPPSYSTTSDPSKPDSWTRPSTFIATEPAIVTQNKGNGTWIDFWVICDDTNCHLFFSDDNGHLYRSQTTKANFPNGFGDPVIAMSGALADLFEASNVYKIKGTDKYLLIVEAIGSGRYFRSWTSDRLDGTWTPLAATQSNPFAGLSNVTFTGTRWANGISHGEVLRDGYDESLTIDTCNLRYLFQGMAADASSYDLNPYKLGLLTAAN